MSPAEIIRALQQDFESYAATRGGAVSIAGDAYHVLELLQDAPKRWRVILHWAGDRADTPGFDTGIVEHELHLVVGLSVGLSLRPGHALVVDRAGEPPVLERFFEIRQRAREARWQDDGQTEQRLIYERSEPLVTPDGIPLAAYRAIFKFAASL